MNKKKVLNAAHTTLTTAICSMLAVGVAQANVNVQLFSASTSPKYTLTEDAMVDGLSKTYHLGATYNYINRPLVELNSERTQRRGDLVTGISTMDIGGGYYINERIFVGSSIPVHLVKIPGEAQQFALGDARLLGKFRLTTKHAPVSFALVPELYLPSGNRDLFVSDGALGAGLRAAAEREFGRFRVSANLGFRHSGDATFRDLQYRNRLTAGLGGNIHLARMWSANVEAQGTLVLPRNSVQNPGEMYAGVRYQPQNGLGVSLGGAVGSVNGVGSADYRLIAGVQFNAIPAPAPLIAAPKKPEKIIVSAVKKPAPKVFFERRRIRITEEVKFEHNSAQLAPSGKELLDEVAMVMKKNQASFKSIVIEGHTNQLGSHAYNMKLSRERAAAVKEYLASRGVPTERLSTVGYGKTRPKDIKGLSKAARLDADRRVEFKVVPYSKVSKATKKTKNI